MFRLSLITVVGVTLLILVFQVTQPPRENLLDDYYSGLVNEMLEVQTVKADWRWHSGPLQGPATEAKEGDYITLSPWSVDWSRTHAEGRRLPEPPPMPKTPVPSLETRFTPVEVASGYAQTDWQLMRVKGIEDHKLQVAVAGGKRLSNDIASFCTTPGEEPELQLYQCYCLPYRVYRFKTEIEVPADSNYPMGRRLIEVGPPWVVWEKPIVMSETWCKASFVENSPSMRKMVPAGRYVLPVREPGKK